MAALHRALRPRHARALPPRPARPGLRRAREVFNAEDRDQARERVDQVLERLEPVAPKVCRLLEDAEEDLIAFYRFPREHWTKLRSTNPLERVNKEIGRRSDVVGIFPNDPSVIRLAGALLIEQNDEWLVHRRYLSAESMALILQDPDIAQSALVRAGRRGGEQSRRGLSRPAPRTPFIATSWLQSGAFSGLLRPSERRPRPIGPPARRRARACRRSPSPSRLG